MESTAAPSAEPAPGDLRAAEASASYASPPFSGSHPAREKFVRSGAAAGAPSPADTDPPPARENALAGFVRARRKAAGMTQRELAELAGVGPRAVYDLERGKATLQMNVANAVLAVFGMTLGVVPAPREDLS